MKTQVEAGSRGMKIQESLPSSGTTSPAKSLAMKPALNLPCRAAAQFNHAAGANAEERARFLKSERAFLHFLAAWLSLGRWAAMRFRHAAIILIAVIGILGGGQFRIAKVTIKEPSRSRTMFRVFAPGQDTSVITSTIFDLTHGDFMCHLYDWVWLQRA